MSTLPDSLPLWERFETIAGKAQREANECHRISDGSGSDGNSRRLHYCEGQCQAWCEAAKMARPVIEELQRLLNEAEKRDAAEYIAKIKAERERDATIKRAEEVARFADSLIDMVDYGDASRLDTDEARRSLEKLMGWEEGRLVSPKEATP